MALDERLVERVEALIEKGDQVLATHKPNPPGVIGFPTLDSGAFAEWQTQSLSFLVNILGPDHVYVENFKRDVESGHRDIVKAGQGILRAVREDLTLGLLHKIRSLVAAEVFSDFLDMAEHLLECGYKDPTASLTGAVLEDSLRQLARRNRIKLRSKEDLSSLNQKCADASVYNRLIQKKIQVWTDVRNHADHGEFGEYSERDVQDMLAGVRDLLAECV